MENRKLIKHSLDYRYYKKNIIYLLFVAIITSLLLLTPINKEYQFLTYIIIGIIIIVLGLLFYNLIRVSKIFNKVNSYEIYEVSLYFNESNKSRRVHFNFLLNDKEYQTKKLFSNRNFSEFNGSNYLRKNVNVAINLMTEEVLVLK